MAAVNINTVVQPTQEQFAALAPGYTHMFVVDVKNGDVSTQTATNTAITFTFPKLMANPSRISKCALYCTEALANTADTGFNTNTVSVGDSNSATAFVAATQLNTNGTPTLFAVSSGGAIPASYTTATDVIITVNSQSGKALSALNQGRFIVLFDLFLPDASLKNRPAAGN